MSAERPSLFVLADEYAECIYAEYGMPRGEQEYRGWMRAAYFAGYDAGINRGSRLLDHEAMP